MVGALWKLWTTNAANGNRNDVGFYFDFRLDTTHEKLIWLENGHWLHHRLAIDQCRVFASSWLLIPGAAEGRGLKAKHYVANLKVIDKDNSILGCAEFDDNDTNECGLCDAKIKIIVTIIWSKCVRTSKSFISSFLSSCAACQFHRLVLVSVCKFLLRPHTRQWEILMVVRGSQTVLDT